MAYLPLIARVNSLPPLPESVLEIESLFLHADPDIDDIVKIIEKDPSLTTDILSKVNAPYYGFTKSIVSILQAVTLFGSSQIRSIVLSSSINRNFNIDLSPYKISTLEFSQVSTMQSELIFQWYLTIDVDLARTLTPIAFLMETGKILIAKDISDKQQEQEFSDNLDKYEDIAYVENIFSMMSSSQVNALIFKHLNLNELFSEIMKYLDNEITVPSNIKEMITALQIVRTAVNIKSQLSDTSIDKAVLLLEKNNYEVAPFLRVVKRLQIKYL